MDFKKALNAITAIEKEVDINCIKISSTQIWPLIRMMLWYQMMNPTENHVKMDTNSHNYRYIINEKTIETTIEINKNKSIDLLFFSSSAYYTDKCKDLYYNRHVDPFSDLFGKAFTILNMELEDANSHIRQPRKYPGLTISFSEERRAVRSDNTIIPGFDALRRTVQENTGIELDPRLISENLRKLRAFLSLFSSVLEHLKPKAVGVICYYHLAAMGLVWACRRKGIPCVDIQHGKQGRYHGMYTHWTATPPDGYELLPTALWTWGEESRDNIAKWLPKNCRTPRVEVLGSPWLSLWMEGPGCEPAGDGLSRLITRIADRKVILFSMQPLKENPLPVPLFQAMRHSPPSWLWLMRLHPRDAAQQDVWADFFSQYSMDNVECYLANNLPLFALLKHSHHHVTCFSSVAFEALSFGLSTTIIHPSGKLLYDNYLNDGHYRYADSFEKIISSVKIGLLEDKKKESRPYINHNLENIHNHLKALLLTENTTHFAKSPGENYADN